MKKLLSIFLVSCFLLSFAACGNTNSESTPTSAASLNPVLPLETGQTVEEFLNDIENSGQETNPSVLPTETPVQGEFIEQTEKPIQTVQPTTAPTEEGRIVYYTRTGECYHRINPCGNGTYYPCTLDEALERGLRPCEKCNP